MKKNNRFIYLILILFVLVYGLQIGYTSFTKVDEIPIIGYHHLALKEDKERYFKNNMWVNSVDSFEAQMKLLHDEGYHSVTLDDLYLWRMGKKKLPKKSICITFDDGFQSSIRYADPILEKYGFTASVFVIGALVPKTSKPYDASLRQHSSIEDMKHAKTLSFYAHSYDLHHKKDGFRVHQLNKKQLIEDTNRMKQYASIDYYAYPYGKYNDTIEEVLEESGTKLAFGFNENRKAKITDDPYALPRFNVNAYTKIDVFLQMVE